MDFVPALAAAVAITSAVWGAGLAFIRMSSIRMTENAISRAISELEKKFTPREVLEVKLENLESSLTIRIAEMKVIVDRLDKKSPAVFGQLQALVVRLEELRIDIEDRLRKVG